ncbi:ABC transporter permease [Rubellicoccus peritrichatus]|uniref:Transport permease protein n=1 Tax=Rubellicoccus peritrichatus TaxID=3080537 RepID=A0AAQ3LFC3_9BACT|nr:ABC transporter permease [Puniceicoccus sp. CR14]WOO40954.1 ABC transporter permease [Puniceicoccus sp. CR14]
MAVSIEKSWAIQKSVIYALFVRELNSRFGRYRLGYLWAVLEPLALVGVLSAVRLIFGSKDIAGLPYPIFFAAGIIPFYLFQHIVNQSLSAVESNLALMNYQRVKPSDAVVSRVLLESVIALAVGVIFFAGFYKMGFTFEWNSTLGTIAVVLLLIAFSTGIGLIVAVIAPLYQETKKVIPVLIRPFFFISGIFFAADSLPSQYRELALYNPLMQMTELIRMQMFQNYTSQYGSMSYFAICSMISLFIGLAVYRINRIKLATSGSIR